LTVNIFNITGLGTLTRGPMGLYQSHAPKKFIGRCRFFFFLFSVQNVPF